MLSMITTNPNISFFIQKNTAKTLITSSQLYLYYEPLIFALNYSVYFFKSDNKQLLNHANNLEYLQTILLHQK